MDKVVREYPDGVFNWVDLSTSDVEAGEAFYRALFGWDADHIPMGEDGYYVMYRIDGKSVAGMGEIPPDQREMGMPPMWTSYIKHSDVDAVAARAAEAGGMVMFPPMDVFEEGRMTMIQDPTGAVFGVWQPRNHIGAQLVNRPNTLVWNELQTWDKGAAESFYGDVFGWRVEDDANGYGLCAANERVQAGMMQMDENWGDIPSNWATYFMVEDIAATTERARELGANVLVEPTKAGQVGTFSVIQDPQGAIFTAMEMEEGMVDDPPGTS